MIHQFYMYSPLRNSFIERHDFYIAQVKKRVLSQFSDMESETDRFFECEYNRLRSIVESDGDDIATDRAENFYALLDSLRKQTILGALAGCFHQWDKDLRDFIEQELRHTVKPKTAKELAWVPKFGNVYDLLKEFGWDCTACAFFPLMDACGLIVNVYKHGKGRSLDKLAASYPNYLRNMPPNHGLLAKHSFLDHEQLEISVVQFDELTSAFRQFWESFPDRLYYEDDP